MYIVAVKICLSLGNVLYYLIYEELNGMYKMYNVHVYLKEISKLEISKG